MSMVDMLQQTFMVAWPGLLLVIAGAIFLPTVRYLIAPGIDPGDTNRQLAVSMMRGFGWVLIFVGTIFAGYRAITYQVDVLTDGEPVRLLIGLAMALPALFIGLLVGSVFSLLSSRQSSTSL